MNDSADYRLQIIARFNAAREYFRTAPLECVAAEIVKQGLDVVDKRDRLAAIAVAVAELDGGGSWVRDDAR